MWEDRWHRTERAARRRRRRAAPEPAEEDPGFDDKPLDKHRGLLKHESSILIQARTGKIGLQAFLHNRRVPGADTPLCRCGLAAETAYHITVACPQTSDDRRRLRAQTRLSLNGGRDFALLLRDAVHAQTFARWFLRLGRLSEYIVALEYGSLFGPSVEEVPKRLLRARRPQREREGF
jgi:hypothetical protein